MDAELAAASEFMVRPDLRDIATTRSLVATAEPSGSSAEYRYAPRVLVEDLTPENSGSPVAVRVYKPRDNLGRLPVLVFMHGGAFVAGDVGSEHGRCLTFAAEAECVVVSVDYRLAPEHPYPAALEDCYSTAEWVAAGGGTADLDPGRLAVGGVSAGGALAAGVAMMSRDSGGPVLRSQLLLFPVLDNEMSTASMRRFDATPVWDSRNNAVMWDHYLAERAHINDAQYAAPGRVKDLAGLPETYLLTAEFDPLRDEGISYAQRLLKAHVPVDLRHVAGAYHVFDQLVPDAEISQRSLSDQVAFLRRTLRA